MFNVEVNCL